MSREQIVIWDTTITLTIGGVEQALNATCRGIHYPAMPGSFEKGGLQLEPDEPEYVEVTSVKVSYNVGDRNIMVEISQLLSSAQIEQLSIDYFNQSSE